MTIFLSTQTKNRPKRGDLRKLQFKSMASFQVQNTGLIWLTYLLNSGLKRGSKDQVAKDIWQWCNGSFRYLGACSLESLLNVPGVTLRDAELVCLAMSLSRLRLEEKFETNHIRSSSDAMQLLEAKFLGEEVEHFYCMYLNRGNRVLRLEQLSSGGISSTVVDVRMILKRALELRASGILVAHNHPSGNLTFSSEDLELTHRIKKAGKYMDIQLIDHLIVFENQYLSLADEGRMPN